MKDKMFRTVVKTITFKLFTTTATAIIIGSLKGAIFIHIVMTLIYIIHERAWNRITWGKSLKTNQHEVLHHEPDGHLPGESAFQ